MGVSRSSRQTGCANPYGLGWQPHPLSVTSQPTLPPSIFLCSFAGAYHRPLFTFLDLPCSDPASLTTPPTLAQPLPCPQAALEPLCFANCLHAEAAPR